MKTLLQAALAALLVLTTGNCAMGRQSTGDSETLRVLIYNIHAGRDADKQYNLHRVAEIVKETRADIVLLQEVDRLTRRSVKVDQVAELERLTGFNAAFGMTIDYDEGEYGIAVLSRWPITHSELHILPVEHPEDKDPEDYEERGLQHVIIAAPHGTLHVLNTHMDATPDDGRYREQQAETIAKRAEQVLRTGDLVILGGDPNDTPGTRTIEILTGGSFRDAWEGCGEGEGLTFPQDEPDRRIDWLFIPPALRCLAAEVLDYRASDHRPVLFVLSVR